MNEIWTPHATTACIVEQDNAYLMVEEISHGQQVFNQPAGHVDKGESILAAAARETLEETAWEIELTGFVGLYVYTAPQNGVCYHRYCFSGKAIRDTKRPLDEDIVQAHWLSFEEILSLETKLRSPLVLKCLQDYRSRPLLPLDYIYEHKVKDLK